MKRFLSLCLAALMTATLLAGCNTKTGGEEGKKDPESGGKTGVKDTLVIAQNADIYSMDPQLKVDTQSGRIKTLVFESLVSTDSENNILPSIAKSWEFIDDTTIHFVINDGITFHNGDKLTMDDILFSFQRGENAPQTSATMDPIDIANCKAIDEKTFEMKLKYPFGAIMLNLADTKCSIVNKKYVEEVGDEQFAQKPIGTGPYVFANWKSGDRCELKTYDGYWGKKPAIPNITFRVITEGANRAIELETGGVDVALDIQPGDVERISSNPDLTLQRGPNYSVTYMAMNQSKKPFDDVRVRQAINLALDLPSIVDAVYQGTGSVGCGPLTPSVWGYDKNLKAPQQNIDKAKELLAEAGYPDGFSTTILTSDHQQRMDFSEIAQNQLSAIGIKCEVKIMEWGAYLDAVFAGEHEMTVLGYSYGADPYTGMFNLFASTCFGPDGNISWYANAEVDALFEQIKVENDDDKRRTMVEKLQQIIVDDAVWVNIWQGENIDGTVKNLKGWQNRGDSMYRFMDMSFE